MKYLFSYYNRLLALLAMYTASRIYFYINNIETIDLHYALEFLEGLRFDLSALVYINIPLFVLLLLPHNLRTHNYYHRVTNWLFYIINIPFLILNNIDIEYFKFTQKRSTIDFLQLIQLSSDAKNIIPQYMKDYWPITLFSMLQIYLLLKIKQLPKQKFTLKINPNESPPRYIGEEFARMLIKLFTSKELLILAFASGVFIVSARGGLQLKPIKPINAGELSSSQNTTLVLNTPFCIIHSLNEQKVRNYTYFSRKELDNIYSPLHSPSKLKITKENIIILIMESYSKEFIGFYNNGVGYTPFLDSLMQHSLTFKNGYANGLKSIEALPAITASIPALMKNPFITSNYAQNNFESIASHLKKEGYNTSFYHGGIRGTMGFYSFSKKAGFTDYFGMEEYNNDKDFDGCWGVYDGPFMNFFANTLNKKKEPFFSTFFSLSSHPPYNLPENYTKQIDIKHEKVGIKETIQYTDHSMKDFFKKIKKQKWFKNTIFIITADHTASTNYNEEYKNKIGRYAIPIIIFKGDNSLKGINKNIVQQIDIMPTVLTMINYPKPYFAFGKSMFSESWGINLLNNEYRFITENAIITNNQEDYLCFSDWSTSEKVKMINSDKNLLQAIKQDYNDRMINNKLIYEN